MAGFDDVLFWGIRLFFLKFVVTIFLQVRARMGSGKTSHPEDKRGLSAFHTILRMSVLGYGPLIVDPTRCDQYLLNCFTQEFGTVFFLTMWQHQASFPSWAATAFTYFVYSRLAHGVFYLLELQPFRTFSYLPSFAVLGAFAVFSFL